MFRVEFYEQPDGSSPVREMLDGLRDKAVTSKDARIRLAKITSHINALAEYGSRLGAPSVKHIDGGIWELRPLRDRILYFFAVGGTYVLLHHFVKSTRKTPRREIEQAKREMRDYLERNK